MALVELPPGAVAAARAAGGVSDASAAGPVTSADAKWVQDLLHYCHAIECPVKCIAGRLYVRISGTRAELLSALLRGPTPCALLRCPTPCALLHGDPLPTASPPFLVQPISTIACPTTNGWPQHSAASPSSTGSNDKPHASCGCACPPPTQSRRHLTRPPCPLALPSLCVSALHLPLYLLRPCAPLAH